MCKTKAHGGKRCNDSRTSRQALNYAMSTVFNIEEDHAGRLTTAFRKEESALHKALLAQQKNPDTEWETIVSEYGLQEENLEAAQERWNTLLDGQSINDYQYNKAATPQEARTFWNQLKQLAARMSTKEQRKVLVRRITEAMKHKLPAGLIRSFNQMKEIFSKRNVKMSGVALGLAATMFLTACGGGHDNKVTDPVAQPTTTQSQSAAATASPSATASPTLTQAQKNEKLKADLAAAPFGINVDDVVKNHTDVNPKFPLKLSEIYPSANFDIKAGALKALNVYQDIQSIQNFNLAGTPASDKELISASFATSKEKPVSPMDKRLLDEVIAKADKGERLSLIPTINADGKIGNVDGVDYYSSGKVAKPSFGIPELYAEAATDKYPNLMTVHGFYNRPYPTTTGQAVVVRTEYWISVAPSGDDNKDWTVQGMKYYVPEDPKLGG